MISGLGEPPVAPYDSGALLLDTHVFLWLVGAPDHLKPETLDLVRRTEGAGRLVVPVFSIWEVSLLVAKGRLSLPSPPRHWFREVLSRSAFALAPLTPEIAIESNELPGGLPGDPADRIIVATSRIEGLTLLTCDRLILRYGEEGHVRVLAA